MPSILVVDDDESAADLFVAIFRRFGYDVTAAHTGQSALEYLTRALPDLVVLDLMMPDMNGVEILEKIRGDSRTAAVPVVMFSALDDAEWRERATDAGANDFWIKGGFGVGELEASVRSRVGA